MGERIWVAGHNGMVGSALVRLLEKQGREVLKVDKPTLDLRDQPKVEAWVKENKPSSIILAAAKVGGILANSTYPAEFIYDNLAIQTNVIHSAHKFDINRLVFLGSSCVYPKFAEQPIKESSLLTGPLEPTNEWYAIAKISGIMTCQAYRKQYGRKYISVMPCNLYGPNDNFDLETSHVLPALIRKIHEAKVNNSSYVALFGTGKPLREFLHVDDLARGVVFCLDNYDGHEHINCGSGQEISIHDLAELIALIIGYEGKILYDQSKPDGTPRKVMDSNHIFGLGWKPTIPLGMGIKDTYHWYLNNH